MISWTKNNIKIIDLLIKVGANINVTNALGDTCVNIAQRKGYH